MKTEDYGKFFNNYLLTTYKKGFVWWYNLAEEKRRAIYKEAEELFREKVSITKENSRTRRANVLDYKTLASGDK